MKSAPLEWGNLCADVCTQWLIRVSPKHYPSFSEPESQQFPSVDYYRLQRRETSQVRRQVQSETAFLNNKKNGKKSVGPWAKSKNKGGIEELTTSVSRSTFIPAAASVTEGDVIQKKKKKSCWWRAVGHVASSEHTVVLVSVLHLNS